MDSKLQDKAIAASLSLSYSPLPGPDFIRVLTIHPAATLDEPIIAAIELLHLDPRVGHVAQPANEEALSATTASSGRYDALSYSWAMNTDGDSSFNRMMLIDGKFKAITQNLYDGLRRLRTHISPLRIWVDAVCIDQSNNEERSAQVARMAEIYANADRVLMWLGDGHPEEDMEMYKFLTRIAEHAKTAQMVHKSCAMKAFMSSAAFRCKCTEADRSAKLPLLELTPRSYRTSALERLDIEDARRVAKAYNAFFKRRYWSRRWIIQELTHAKQQYWFWGPCGFQRIDAVQDWLDTVDGAYVRLKGDLKYHLGLSLVAPVISESELLPDLHPIAALTYPLKQRRHHLRSLTRTVARFSSWNCADPRDRIFALASMCEPKFKADYSLSTAQVFTDFARLLIEQQKYSWLFGNLQTNQMYELADFGLEPCGLPSWVPDLRLPFDEHPYGFTSDLILIHVTEEISLECEIRCIGVFRKHETSQKQNALSLVPTFERDDPLPNTQSRTIHFNDDGYNADVGMPDVIEPGDIMASLTQEWNGNDFALILRALDGYADKYTIVHVQVSFTGGIADHEGWELNAQDVARRRKMTIRIV